MEPLNGQTEMKQAAPEILKPEWLEPWDNNALYTAASLNYGDPLTLIILFHENPSLKSY